MSLTIEAINKVAEEEIKRVHNLGEQKVEQYNYQCPLTIGDCDRGECEWWDHREKQCVVHTIASGLQLLSVELKYR
uniref:Uncharacterized protein n=1 Tax=viral metagenome TaxID=1070528 RepID=A0A6H1ZN94_9ZZZZ